MSFVSLQNGVSTRKARFSQKTSLLDDVQCAEENELRLIILAHTLYVRLDSLDNVFPVL